MSERFVIGDVVTINNGIQKHRILEIDGPLARLDNGWGVHVNHLHLVEDEGSVRDGTQLRTYYGQHHYGMTRENGPTIKLDKTRLPIETVEHFINTYHRRSRWVIFGNPELPYYIVRSNATVIERLRIVAWTANNLPRTLAS